MPSSRSSVAPLVVGITGHRILTNLAPLQAGIERAVARIRRAYPRRTLRALSQLAEGADRLCAEAVLRTDGAQLHALLPFPKEDYARDFGAEGSPSRVHFESLLSRAAKIIRLPTPRQREAGYVRANQAVLKCCDVLLAVWDGRPAQGKAGTANVVARARAMGKPVVIVCAGNRKLRTRHPTSLGRQQGEVIFPRFPRR